MQSFVFTLHKEPSSVFIFLPERQNGQVAAFQYGECDRNYIGETGRRTGKRIDETFYNVDDFSIIGSG